MPKTLESPLRGVRNKPTLTDVIKLALRNAKLGIRTAIPARVLIYNPATQTAEVSLELLSVITTDLGEQVQKPIKLVEIPVAWPRTATGYLTFPLVPTDTGLLVVSDRSLEKWATQGVPTDPAFSHTHNPIDGVFLPGLHPDTTPIIPPTSLTDTVLEGPLISLGVGGVDFLIKGTALVAALAPIIATLTAVPPATDPASVIVLANANKAAILAALAAIGANLSIKTKTL